MWTRVQASLAKSSYSALLGGLSVLLLNACALQVVTPAIEVTPTSVTIPSGSTQSLSTIGGNPPYIFTVFSGAGSVTVGSTSGELVANTPGSAVIRVYDAGGQSVDVPVTVVSTLSASPPSITLPSHVGAKHTFSGSGGVPPYSFELASGPGSIDSSTGLYSAGNSPGSAVIKITDAIGSTVTASARVTESLTNGKVNSTAVQGNSLFAVGSFTAAHPASAPRIFALDVATGTPDYGIDFQDGFDGTVRAILISGNSAFVGGDFYTYRGQPASRLAKIDLSTGALDPIFPAFAADGPVYTLAQVGSSLYVGGSFSRFQGYSAPNLAKVDINTGALDRTFSQSGGTNNIVYAIQAVGQNIYIGGSFTQYQGQPVVGLAKVNASTGDTDPGFVSDLGAGTVYALLPTSSALYAGGSFTKKLAKLNLSTGVVDTTFTQATGILGTAVHALSATESALFAGGDFYQYRGTNVVPLIKVDLNTGNLDTTFTRSSGLNDYSYYLSSARIGVLSARAEGLWVGGDFSFYNGVNVGGIMRLDLISGDLDSSFARPGTESTVFAFAFSQSKALLGGAFQFYGGVPAERIAKFSLGDLNADSDFSSQGGFNKEAKEIATDGSSLYVGVDEAWPRYRNTPVGVLLKMDLVHGDLDPGFSAPGGTTFLSHGLLAAPQGLFVSGPSFFAQLNLSTGAVIHNFADPCYYEAMESSGQATQTSLAVQGDQLIYSVADTSGDCGYLQRIDLNTYNIQSLPLPAADGYFRVVNPDAIAIQGNSLFVSTSDTSPRLLKYDLTTLVRDMAFSSGASPNGKINAWVTTSDSVYIAGDFTQHQGTKAQHLAKLDPVTGALDPSFGQTIGLGNSALSLSIFGSTLFVGGPFTTYQSQSANYLIPVDLLTGARQ